MTGYLLHQLLSKSAKKYPDKNAVEFMEQCLTYRNLEATSNQIAKAMAQAGLKKGRRVAMIFNKSIEAIIGLFSILKAGCAYVPIDPNMPTSRINFILQNADINFLLTSSELALKLLPKLSEGASLRRIFISGEKIKELKGNRNNLKASFWEDIFKSKSEIYNSCEITDTYPAYILYTSGSTGSPKGVMISHLNSLTFVNMAANFFGISSNDKLCSHAPLHFDLSVFDIFVAVKSGATIVLVPEHLAVFPIKLAEYIDKKQISVWNSVPSVLSLLAERGKTEKFRFDSLRLVLFAGEIFPIKYLRKIMNHMQNASFYNMYGQTEANSSTFYQIKDLSDDDAWKIPIGKPFPNYEVFALDQKNRIINRPGLEGELYIRGSAVAMGYWKDTEKTAASFVQDPIQTFSSSKVYKTGDVVSLDDSGNYIYVGRKDHMVKSRGYRIEIDEIEIALHSYPGIRQAAIITVPDDLIGNRIFGYVSVVDDEKIQEPEILEHCAKRIPVYMLPEAVEICPSLPTTSTGKIDRKMLTNEALLKFKPKIES